MSITLVVAIVNEIEIGGAKGEMSKPRISFLTQEEMEAIHNASLQVLEKTGIKVMSEIALDILKKG